MLWASMSVCSDVCIAALGQEPERISVAVSAAWGHTFDNSGILTWSALAIPFQVIVFHAAVRQPVVHANCPTVITTNTSLTLFIHSEAFLLLKWLKMVAAWLRSS